MSRLIQQKEYPDDYSDDVKSVLNKMSFTDGKKLLIFGSMSLRSQLYAGDFDGYEIVDNDGKTKEGYLLDLVNKFKSNIRALQNTPLTYIGDIKCGEIEEWKILNDDIEIKNERVINYNAQQSKKNLNHLYQIGLIEKVEFDNIYSKLLFTITPKEYFELKDLCKFHIVRWKPDEILMGYKTLPNDIKYHLKDGINSKSTTKMDVISWVNGNRFTDFSVIYQFNYDGRPINGVIKDLEKSFKENILGFYLEKQYFKMLKRIFAYSKFKKDYYTVFELSYFFNSDVGRIYQIIGDIKTLEYLFENEETIPLSRVNFEIDQFKNRLSNVILPKFLVERTEILKVINQLDNIHKLQRAERLQKLRKLRGYLEGLMNYYTKVFFKGSNIDLKRYFP